MANTTSGTTTFDKNFSIDEIMEEAYERLGIQGVSGNQLRLARRSLNIMLQEWGNRGIHYWEIADTNIDLVQGQAEYDFFRASVRWYKCHYNSNKWHLWNVRYFRSSIKTKL
jgi:hypothetical protein